MLDFLKKHWIFFGLLAVFLWAVYAVETKIAKAAAFALSVATWFIAPFLWAWLISVWAMGFVLGFLPNSFFDWIPRKSTGTNLKADLVHQTEAP